MIVEKLSPRGYRITEGDKVLETPYDWEPEAVLHFLQKYGTEEEIQEQLRKITLLIASQDLMCGRFTIIQIPRTESWRDYQLHKDNNIWYIPSSDEEVIEQILAGTEFIQTGVSRDGGEMFWVPVWVPENIKGGFMEVLAELITTPCYGWASYNFPTISLILPSTEGKYYAMVRLRGVEGASFFSSEEEAKEFCQNIIEYLRSDEGLLPIA